MPALVPTETYQLVMRPYVLCLNVGGKCLCWCKEGYLRVLSDDVYIIKIPDIQPLGFTPLRTVHWSGLNFSKVWGYTYLPVPGCFHAKYSGFKEERFSPRIPLGMGSRNSTRTTPWTLPRRVRGSLPPPKWSRPGFIWGLCAENRLLNWICCLFFVALGTLTPFPQLQYTANAINDDAILANILSFCFTAVCCVDGLNIALNRFWS